MTISDAARRSLTAIVLAAGKGTRMRSERPKVLHAVAGRSMLVKRLKPIPAEAVVRGYLAGSGWKEY